MTTKKTSSEAILSVNTGSEIDIDQLEREMNSKRFKETFAFEMGREAGFREAMETISQSNKQFFKHVQRFAEHWRLFLNMSFGDGCQIKQLRIGLNRMMIPTVLTVVSSDSVVDNRALRDCARRFELAIERKVKGSMQICYWTMRDGSLDQEGIESDFPMYRTLN